MSSWDDLKREFRDMHETSAERSHVSGDARRRIDEIIDSEMDASRDTPQTVAIARRVVAELSSSELEGLVSDWLEGRGRGL